MVILGVLLLVVGAVVLVDMGATSNGTVDLHVLGWHIGTMGPGRALLIGAAIGAVLAFGLVFVLSGQRRSRRRRRDRDKTIAGTRAENRRLAAELEAQKARAHEAEVARADETAAERDRAEAYPTEDRRGGAEYVLGSKYPQDASTSTATTPPAPPTR